MQVTELRGTPTDHMMGQLLRVEEHGQILSHCFNINLDTTQGFQGNSKTSEERALAVRLYWLEEEARQYSEWENNGVDDSGNRYTAKHWIADCTPVLDKVCKLLGLEPLAYSVVNALPIDICDDSRIVWMNSDSRGYTLKFNEEFTKKELDGIERDFGGYGIVGPEVIGETLWAENLFR